MLDFILVEELSNGQRGVVHRPRDIVIICRFVGRIVEMYEQRLGDLE